MDSIDTQLFVAARACNVDALKTLLDEHPDKLDAREDPYEWTVLHAAANEGCFPAVDLLLTRGADPNTRERGDRTYAMHWAAAAGNADIVKRLIDAGGDVVGHGDDHELEVIGWATCWEGCDDQRHRDVVDVLLAHGAQHHIFSAIAMNLADEVRRIVSRDPSAINQRLSRNENNQTPLHFAVRMNRPQMVSLLIELGADPLAIDGGGQPVASYAKTKDVDRASMEKIHSITMSEISSAERGGRRIRAEQMDLIASLSLSDWKTAARLVDDNPALIRTPGPLHLAAKRSDAESVKWLLDHGADPNALWTHWDADVTPLHLACFSCSAEVARILLTAGADPNIHDSRHAGDALDWARHFGCLEIVKLLSEK
jgi:ankyrin repeat protein